MPDSEPGDPSTAIVDHLRAIAAAAEIEVSDAQLQTVAQQLLMLLRRFPAATDAIDLGQTEPAFGLRTAKS